MFCVRLLLVIRALLHTINWTCLPFSPYYALVCLQVLQTHLTCTKLSSSISLARPDESKFLTDDFQRSRITSTSASASATRLGSASPAPSTYEDDEFFDARSTYSQMSGSSSSLGGGAASASGTVDAMLSYYRRRCSELEDSLRDLRAELDMRVTAARFTAACVAKAAATAEAEAALRRLRLRYDDLCRGLQNEVTYLRAFAASQPPAPLIDPSNSSGWNCANANGKKSPGLTEGGRGADPPSFWGSVDFVSVGLGLVVGGALAAAAFSFGLGGSEAQAQGSLEAQTAAAAGTAGQGGVRSEDLPSPSYRRS